MIRFQLKNLPEVHRGHEFFLAENERAITDALDLSGRFAEGYVRANPGFKPHTGKTQKKTGHSIVRTSRGKLLKIFNTAAHAAALDTGARPHVIRARNRNHLRFKGRDGRMVFRESVNHPGNRAYKFLFRAHHAADRVFRQDMTRRMTALASRF